MVFGVSHGNTQPLRREQKTLLVARSSQQPKLASKWPSAACSYLGTPPLAATLLAPLVAVVVVWRRQQTQVQNRFARFCILQHARNYLQPPCLPWGTFVDEKRSRGDQPNSDDDAGPG